jgi:hemoglobin-like flavoprotein
MQAQQITDVRRSFALLAPTAPLAADLFYQQLFIADPELRRLFKGDLSEQGMRLMQMLGMAIDMLDQPQRLLPMLRQLGARHQGYGVQAAHYDSVGSALMKTLKLGLGPAFTAEVEAAWAAMYAVVAQTMQAGAMSPSMAADNAHVMASA